MASHGVRVGILCCACAYYGGVDAMTDRIFEWIFAKIYIKRIKFDVWGKLGWKWYGGYGVVKKDRMFRLEEADD